RQYAAITGKRPPMTESGGYDMAAVERELAPIFEAARTAKATGEEPQLTAQQKLDESRALEQSNFLLERLEELQAMLFKTKDGKIRRGPQGEPIAADINATGPLAGSTVGRATAFGSAVL